LRKSGLVTKLALTAVTTVVLVIIAGYIYLHTRRAQFSSRSVASIDLRREGLTSTLTNSYQVSITNRVACERILQEFSHAHWVFGFSQGATELSIRYLDGQTDVVWLAPGMPGEYYTILTSSGAFRMPRADVFKVLADGGVDVSRIP
jgi:hypothetical protein